MFGIGASGSLVDSPSSEAGGWLLTTALGTAIASLSFLVFLLCDRGAKNRAGFRLGTRPPRTKVRLMGNSQGRDNVKKRAARRKKTDRLAAAKAAKKKTAK
ncbi:hypothetical protein BH18VER2_BH18VER2_00080 [soil metagenome]